MYITIYQYCIRGRRSLGIVSICVFSEECLLKANQMQLEIPQKPEFFIAEQLNLNSIQALPIHMSHALHVYNLPKYHNDPFDRMIIAQA